MSASDDQMDPASKDWSMMDDHAYISTVEDEEAATMDAAQIEDFSEVASFEATTDDDAEPAEITKPSTPTPERIEDIILGKKIPKELKSILELSKEAKIDVNMAHKRKSVNDSENSGSSERSETPDRNKKRLNKLSPPAEGDSLLDDSKADSPHTTRMISTKDKVTWKRRVEGSVGGATSSTDHKIVKRMPMPPRNSANVRNHKDSFCWQCHRNGVNVSCETCPRSYHHKCIKTLIIDADHWPCPECIAILTAENVKTRSIAMKDVSLEQLCELLKFAHRRMVQIADTDPFMHPVNEAEFPDYYSYIVQPMDLSTLQKNIKENTYGSTIAFEADAKWILHNSIIFNTYQSKLTSIAKTIVRICKHEMSEIENCYTCYLNANTKKNWFVEVCPKPHPIIWAKLKGFPYWPAKAMCTNNVGMVDCRFFGAHDRAWVSYKDCYLYCQQDPNSNKQKRLDIIECIKEVEVYIENLCKVYEEFNFAPFKTLYDPDSELKQLQILLPKYNSDEPPTKTVPKIKIVAKKTSETEPVIFKVKEPKKELKTDETFSETEDEEESETEETSEEEEEVLSSSSEDEEVETNIRNKRKVIVEDDSDFSENEEIKIIKRMRTRKRGTRRTSNVSRRSLESLESSEQSAQNTDTEEQEAADEENDAYESPKTSSKETEINPNKISDMIMKKLSQSNEMGEDSADDKEITEAGIEDDTSNKTKQNINDSIDEKKNEEIETSFESSEAEDGSDKEIPHVTGDMEMDEDDAKADEAVDNTSDVPKDLEPKDNELNKDDDKPETDKPPSESADDKDATVDLATQNETIETLPPDETTHDSITSLDKKSTEEDSTEKETKSSKEEEETAPENPLEVTSRRSSKDSKADNPVPALIKLTNLVESTGQKRKKSSDSSSTESDVVQQSKKPTKEDDKKDGTSTSNGYESIQSILKRQGKTKCSTPQPPPSKPPTDTVLSTNKDPTNEKSIAKDTSKPNKDKDATIAKPGTPTITTTDPLADDVVIIASTEVKSEPASPEFSSSSTEEDDEYADNRYMMAKLQYLSALNISEKRPLDKNKDKKQEIRTRSKTEELAKGRTIVNEGMLKNIASYLENAGDEITIHKKRHLPTTTSSDHPTSTAIKALQNNTNITLKQRARKSFPKPQQQQLHLVNQLVTTKTSLPLNPAVLPLLGKDGTTLIKGNMSATAIIAKGNAAAAAAAAKGAEVKRSVSILNANVTAGGMVGQVVANPVPIGAVCNTVATTTTSNLMILSHPQAGTVVLPAGSTLPQSLAPYLSSYYYVTPSTQQQVIAATTTTAATNVTATATIQTTALPPLSAIQPLQIVQQTQTVANSVIGASGDLAPDKIATLDLTSSPTAQPPASTVAAAQTSIPATASQTSITGTSLNPVVGTDSAIAADDINVYDPNILNGLVPENITRAVADLFCKRVPPKLKPRPPGALSQQFEAGVGSEAGPVAARINSVAHRFTDYFRGMLVETLSDLGAANPEAIIASLRLENETMKQRHAEEMLEIKKNVNTLMGDIQKSVAEEKDKIIEDTKTKCEQETIRRVNETKSKQWCANCLKEAQFYCCWNTSYCDYPCQAKHWLKHQYKCTQELNNQQQGQQITAGGATSSATGGTKQPQSGQPIVLRHSAPPPKGFTGKILKTTSKVLVNSRGNAKIPMNVLRRASNGSGHITIIESTPGNYELVGNGPITLGPNKNSPQGLMKVKNTAGSSSGANNKPQSLTANLPPNSKAILMNKSVAAAASPNVNSLMKNNNHGGGPGGPKQAVSSNSNSKATNMRNNVDSAAAAGGNRT